MTRFLLHIGTNKTGTTAIQSALWRNRERLADAGALYPDLGVEHFGHHGIARAIKTGEPERFDLCRDWHSQLLERAEAYGLVVVSSEEFHTIGDPAKVAAYFPPDRTDIVLYVREHAAYLASWYQQAVQMRNITYALDEFAQIMRVDLSGLAARWQAVFGADRVAVRMYRSEPSRQWNSVRDFLRHVLALPWANTARAPAIVNPSISGNLLFFKRILNAVLTVEEARETALELDRLSTLDDRFVGRIEVPAELVQRIAWQYRHDRRALRERFGVRMVPPEGGFAGQPYPDLARLHEDWRVILAAAAEGKLRLGTYAERLPLAQP